MIDLTRDEIDELLHEQVVARVGCHVDGLTYVVPLIYAYDGDAVYVASIEGQKVEMMRANPNVCFEVDAYGSEGWRSAIVQGVFEELSETEKPRALELLRERFTRNGVAPSRTPETNGRPSVCFRIAFRDVTGRARR
jgi:nitroimidazol reductase NimA-like FMN-containing flavoprotein (pyridoxamine 5'-phosphate oxidase superfamily)